MRELRTFGASVRAVTAGGREFAGQAAVFDTETPIGNPYRWGFFEKVNRDAFDNTIVADDVVFLSDHDPAKPHARTSEGTLMLATTTGLDVVCPDIPATSYGNDLVINLQNRNVKGMSFGFEVLDDAWSSRSVAMPDGSTSSVEVRELLAVKLYEVSTTAFPAYPTTTAGVRAALAARKVAGASAIVTVRGYAEASALRDRLICEWREGKTLSSDTVSALQEVLDLIAEADDAVDAAQPLLAGLMGVPNPDAGDEDTGDESDASEEASRAVAMWDRCRSALAAYTGLAVGH